ncbi:MAG: large subunit ribosomal protein L4 [Nitriliruptoraceae bacterium]|jgi:large subunit ribosomal protein L4
MTTIDVKDLSGKTLDSITLPAAWFDAEIKPHVMHEVVTAQLSTARQGTHKTKTRAERRGGGRKPYRQKGTGNARQGSIRSPQFIGGGTAHGRTPSDWSVRVNKKVKRTALRSALTDRFQGGNVTVVRDLSFSAPRTKDAVAAISALGHDGLTVLVVLSTQDDATRKCFRNLQDVHVLTVDQLNTLDIIKRDVVVFDEPALELIGTGKRAGQEDAA